MKSVGFIIGSLMFSVFALAVPSENPNKYLTKRVVEIEWDEIPEAAQYDLEIYDGKNKRFIKLFSSKTNVFKLNVKMGKYYFRSRIIDRFDRNSEWTDLAELVIAPPPPQVTSKIPVDTQLFAGKHTGLFELPLSWEASPGIEEYKIVLETPEGTLVNEFKVRSNSVKVKVPPGLYRFRVHAILSDGTVSEGSLPTPVVSVLGAKILPPVVETPKNFKLGQAISFQSELTRAYFEGELLYKPLEGTEWLQVKLLRNFTAKTLVFDSTYRPGLYRLRLQAKAKGFTPSEFGEAEFVIKPKEITLNPIPDETVAALQGKLLEALPTDKAAKPDPSAPASPKPK